MYILFISLGNLWNFHVFQDPDWRRRGKVLII